jgi:predicted ATPase
VLGALGRNLSNAEIAAELHLSVRTVESHVSSLLRKLGAADRHELAAQATALQPPDGERRPLTGLPAARDSFVGRTEELAAVVDALETGRLVTLVGPGGMGKTRLATEAARRIAPAFPFGGAFVDLVPATSDYVVHAVAAAVGATERPGVGIDDAVRERLRDGRMLLVLDNCEHVVAAAAAFVDRALGDCPDLVVLATSRERLAVPGEHVLLVPPLALAATADGAATPSDAERLFTDRVAATQQDIHADPAVIAAICHRVEGMPLAIELAAARAASLGADALLQGLDDHLRLLAASGGPHDRHRSLRAVIDWSHQLLDDGERAAFRRLAVFAAGFDLGAAAAVLTEGDAAVAADLVGRLTDKTLLTRFELAGTTRWRMLEAVHAYARERLAESGEREAVEARFADWGRATAQGLEEGLVGDEHWEERFDAVVDDLRAAAEHRCEAPLYATLGHLTYARRFAAEAQAHYERAAAVAPAPDEAASALIAAADVAFANMRADVAVQVLERAADVGGPSIKATALAKATMLAMRFPAEFPSDVPYETVTAWLTRARDVVPADDPRALAHIAMAAPWAASPERPTSDGELAKEALELAQRVDDAVLLSAALDAVGSAAVTNEEAVRVQTERLRLLSRLPRHLPASGGEVADIVHMVSDTPLVAGQLPTAVDYARLVLEEVRNSGIAHMGSAHLVTPLVLQGAFAAAQQEAEVMRDEWQRAGSPVAQWMAPAVLATALTYELQGDDEHAEEWLALAHGLGERIGQGFAPFAELRVALHRGALERAVAVVDAAGDLSMKRNQPYDVFTRAVAAELFAVVGRPEAAAAVDDVLELGRDNDWVAACAQRALGRLTGDRAALEASLAAWDAIGARFEWACTLTLLHDRRDEGIAVLAELGCLPPAV